MRNVGTLRHGEPHRETPTYVGGCLESGVAISEVLMNKRSSPLEIRKLSPNDLEHVARIQQACYSGRFLEPAESFAAKLSVAPDFCFLAVHNRTPVGYVVALPWVFGDVPDLGGLEYAVPEHADGLYIHDIAVTPVARGMGVARALFNGVLNAAGREEYRGVFLVAIKGASAYWKRYGFRAVEVEGEAKNSLSAYGEGAVYMMKANNGK